MWTADDLVGERQPLARRNSSRLQEREQFQQAQRQVVFNVANSGRGIVARLLAALFWTVVCGVVLLWLYLYFGSLRVIFFHLEAPCDQPLGSWLVIWMILPTLHAILDPPPPREVGLETERNKHSLRSGCIHGMWFAIGLAWFHLAKTCQTTNHALYVWVRFVIHIYLFGVFLFLVCPMMLAFFCLQAFRLYHMLIERGWISNPKAASADTIEKLDIVPYDPLLFASSDDNGNDNKADMRPSGECCCCQENFGTEMTIVRTPCGHYYHKECLGEWLKLAKSCPLCRMDLDVDGKNGDENEGSSLESGLGGTEVDGDAELARRLQDEEFQEAAGLR